MLSGVASTAASGGESKLNLEDIVEELLWYLVEVGVGQSVHIDITP